MRTASSLYCVAGAKRGAGSRGGAGRLQSSPACNAWCILSWARCRFSCSCKSEPRSGPGSAHGIWRSCLLAGFRRLILKVKVCSWYLWLLRTFVRRSAQLLFKNWIFDVDCEHALSSSVSCALLSWAVVKRAIMVFTPFEGQLAIFERRKESILLYFCPSVSICGVRV